MRVDTLIKELKKLEPSNQVVVELRIKTGYDEGDIYHSSEIHLARCQTDKVLIITDGVTAAGGW